MITRFALDPRALQPAGQSLMDGRLDSQRLAGAIRDFGVLSLLGERDEAALDLSMRALSEEHGYDFWTPLLKRLQDGGPGIVRASPPRDLTVHDACRDGTLDALRPISDLVVVDTRTPLPGLTDEQVKELYERRGSTLDGDLELALAKAADQSRAIQSVKTLRAETFIKQGTPASAIWTTYFAPLASISSEVNIFDRYMFSGLLRFRRKPGGLQEPKGLRYLLWLLNSLDSDLPPRATVNLFAWPGDEVARSSRGPNPQPYAIEDISSALRKLDRWDRPGYLNLYEYKKLDHDRHIRFSAGHAIKPAQGVDQFRFSQDRLEKNFRYAHVPLGGGLSELSRVEELARNNGSHWVLRSKKGGFEECPNHPTSCQAAPALGQGALVGGGPPS